MFLDAAPGTSMTYSNVGPSLAALAVERVTGARFADRARARVFAPLGMQTTAFGLDALPAGARVAAPYATRGPTFVRLPAPSHVLYPVVDLFSTPRDLARFARAILRGGELDGVRILTQSSIDEMLRVQLPDAAPDDALGWQVRSFGGRRVVGHEGEDSGASTALYLDISPPAPARSSSRTATRSKERTATAPPRSATSSNEPARCRPDFCDALKQHTLTGC